MEEESKLYTSKSTEAQSETLYLCIFWLQIRYEALPDTQMLEQLCGSECIITVFMITHKH